MKKIIIAIIIILLISLGVFFFISNSKVFKTQEIDIFGEKYTIPASYKYTKNTEKYDDGTEDTYMSLYTRKEKNVDMYIRRFDINNMLNEESGSSFEEALYNKGYHYAMIDDEWKEKFKDINVYQFFFKEDENSDYINALIAYVPIVKDDYYEIILRNYNGEFDYETMKEITDILSRKVEN